MDGYYSARRTDIAPFYARYPEPMYVYHMHPNYGMWDSYFMYLLIANAANQSYDEWAYTHYNDPSYIQWHQDMEQQAQNNAQVQAQLSQLDSQVAALKAQNAPTEASDDLPTGVSPAVAISPAAMEQTAQPADGSHWLANVLIFLVALLLGAAATRWFLKRSTKPSGYNW
jgi:hypothetical protein